MPFRFRRSLRIGPGLRINLGKRGASLSIGGKGMTVNVSDRGTRTTVGLPGTGISYSENAPASASRGRGGGWSILFALVGAGILLALLGK